MSRLFLSVLSALVTLTAMTLAAPSPEPSATDWPQFRGPNRDDHSPDKGLLKTWPADGPKLLWKGVGVGEGFSSVAVVGSRVFTMGDKDGSSHVFALSRDKGDIVWSTKVGKAGGNYKGTRCTPAVDGNLLYALGQFGDFVCLETAKGEVKWSKNFQKDFGGRSGGWNYTESPLIDGDRLLCTPGGEKTTLVALNKKTGEEIWKSPPMPAGFRREAGYSSMVISNAVNVKQYVQLTAGGTIGISAKDGKRLWHYSKFNGNTANIPTPIVLGDQVFTGAGYGRGGALLNLKADGDEIKVEEKYHDRALGTRHGGVVVVGDYLYTDSDQSGNVHCANWKTGEIKWKRGRTGKGGGSAALTYADGMLYIRYQNGWVSLVPANSESYVEKGGFKVPNGGSQSWAHPVVIGGRLYIREKDTVWCYDIKSK